MNEKEIVPAPTENLAPSGKGSRRLPVGWTVAIGFFVVWFFLQVAGWWYVFRVHALERKLEGLRPTLSAIALSKQLQETYQASLQAFEEIRKLDFPGNDLLLATLSKRLAPSVTLERIEVDSLRGIRIWGNSIPGIRESEESLVPLFRGLQESGYSVRVKDLSPHPKEPGVWRFELKLEKV